MLRGVVTRLTTFPVAVALTAGMLRYLVRRPELRAAIATDGPIGAVVGGAIGTVAGTADMLSGGSPPAACAPGSSVLPAATHPPLPHPALDSRNAGCRDDGAMVDALFEDPDRVRERDAIRDDPIGDAWISRV